MSGSPAAADVDPDIALILREAEAAGVPDYCTLPPAEARAQAEAVNAAWNQPPVPLASVADLAVPGPAGPIRLRHYRPVEAERLPTIVYLHGGGWTLCSLDTHDRLMRLLARTSGAAVLGVDYRLAPEHPYPAPLEDCLAAFAWARGTGGTHGLDPDRLALAGDSAGANLALGALLRLRDGGKPLPRGAALFYGCYWARFDTGSHARHGHGRWQLSSEQMAWFWRNYLGEAARGDAYAEPLYADLAGLPPLFLNVATHDPLADDTFELARRLEAAGVAYRLDVHPGLIHAFMRMSARCRAAERALDTAAAALRQMLEPA